MARSIDLGEDTFLESSAVVGYKGAVSDSDVDSLVYWEHCGMYRANGITVGGSARSGILFVCASSLKGGIAFVEHILESNGYIWTRRFVNTAFTDWMPIAVPPITVDGNNYIRANSIYSENYETTLNSMYLVRPIQSEVLPDITLNASGYYDLSSAIGAVLPTGRRVVTIGVNVWSESNGAWSIVEYGNNRGYVIGTPGVVIKGLQLTIWYA